MSGYKWAKYAKVIILTMQACMVVGGACKVDMWPPSYSSVVYEQKNVLSMQLSGD